MEMKEKGTRKWHEAKLTGNHEKRCIYSNLTLHIQSHNSNNVCYYVIIHDYASQNLIFLSQIVVAHIR